MGVAIFIFGQAILALLLFVGIIWGALKLIDKSARPDANGPAHMLILALGALTFVGSLVMGGQLKSGGTTVTASNWEKRYCSNAGEEIYKTVENVRGVYYQQPGVVHSGSRFHENDGDHRAYLERPARLYDFYEVKRNPNELVERHEVINRKILSKRQDAPTARYAFTWSPISTEQDSKAGVHGQELEVFDRETGEVLGRRVLYYYAPLHQSQPHGMPVPVCPEAQLQPDIRYIDGQIRDSYQFVSRVLKPPAPSPEERARLYDLFKGSGSRSKKCLGYAWIGDGVKPGELTLSRIGQDLHIKIAATGDSLTCRDHFFSAPSPSRFAPLRFADGGVITAEEFREFFPHAGPR